MNHEEFKELELKIDTIYRVIDHLSKLDEETKEEYLDALDTVKFWASKGHYLNKPEQLELGEEYGDIGELALLDAARKNHMHNDSITAVKEGDRTVFTIQPTGAALIWEWGREFEKLCARQPK